jgi:hypothetical protein
MSADGHGIRGVERAVTSDREREILKKLSVGDFQTGLKTKNPIYFVGSRTGGWVASNSSMIIFLLLRFRYQQGV